MSYRPPFSYYTTPSQRDREALHRLRVTLEAEHFADTTPPDLDDLAAFERALESKAPNAR